MAALVPGEKARMYAIGGLARGGATRGGYTSMRAFIAIGGVQVGTSPAGAGVVTIASLAIRDILNESANTCQMLARGFTPALGAPIVVTLGTPNSLTRYFGGRVLSLGQAYLVQNPGQAAAIVHPVNGIDPTWQLDQHLVSKRYTNQNAAAVIRDLVTTYAEGITATHVRAELEAVLLDEITFTNTALSDAISQVCDRAGAYWYVDYFADLHAFFAEPTTELPNPRDLTPDHPSLQSVSDETDLSQMITRVLVEGGGVTAMANLAPGETLIPVDTAAWYQAAGGQVVSGPQRLNYTGIDAGGLGSFVGPGAGPAAAPVQADSATAGGLTPGNNYTHAYSFVTASGESRVGPIATFWLNGPPTAPDYALLQNNPVTNGAYTNLFTAGSTVSFLYQYTTSPWASSSAPNHSASSPISGPITVPAYTGSGAPAGAVSAPNLFYKHTADARIQGIAIYFQYSGTGATWKLFQVVANDPTHAGSIVMLTLGGYAPFSPLANLGSHTDNIGGQTSIALSGVAIGPAAVTARKIYRTKATDALNLYLVATIANNTATTYVDSIADGSLGATAPASDTSGLTQPTGQVPAGSTSLLLASAAAFRASGGFVIIGNGEQVVRYTGISGNSLTGIPALGDGSITAAVAYNSTATAAPLILGIPASGAGAILYAIKRGDEVNLLVTVEDAAAQALLASYIGGTGIKETYVQDRRISYTEAIARGRAILQQRSAPETAVSYVVRDPRTRAGRTITAALPGPYVLAGTFRIQDVAIGLFSGVKGQPPTFTVKASSARYSLEDLLRVARNRIGA